MFCHSCSICRPLGMLDRVQPSLSRHLACCRLQPSLSKSRIGSCCPLKRNRSAHATSVCVASGAAVQADIVEPLRSQQASNAGPQQQWHQIVTESVLEPEKLVKLVMKAKISLGPSSVLANVSNAAHERNTAADSMATTAAVSGMPYKQLTMRPVMLKGKLLLQISLLDSRQDITKNYVPDQAVGQLQQLLLLPWQSASLQTTTHITNIQISKKGKVLIQNSKLPPEPAAAEQSNGMSLLQQPRQPQQQQQGLSSSWSAVPAATAGPISLQHDRVKAVPINGSISDPFLQKIGLQTSEGRIKANMQAKFTQINEFLKLLIHTGELESMIQQQQQQHEEAAAPISSSSSNSSSSIHILDCGCGSSHLTFGTYHYLSHVRGVAIKLTGIDTNKALMDRSNRYCEDLGISDHARFCTAAIRDYQPQQQPDIVLALHACDTATDQSLTLGVRSGANIIMSVPCCHKDLHQQQQRQQQQQGRRQRSSSSVDLFDPLLSHGILRQRMLDLLTDTFRAHLLRLAGYRTEVVEFVSGEHTPRNLLIRAVKQRGPLPEAERMRLAEQYTQLKQYWGVTPHLEKLLREDGVMTDSL